MTLDLAAIEAPLTDADLVVLHGIWDAPPVDPRNVEGVLASAVAAQFAAEHRLVQRLLAEIDRRGAAVRTLEAERDQAQAQAEDCVAVVDLWQAKGVKYEARVTALEVANKSLQRASDAWERKSKNNGLAAAIQTERLDEAETRVTTLRARVTALEEALKPFAALLASHHKHGDDAPVFGVNESIITLGDLRRAAALLTKEGV